MRRLPSDARHLLVLSLVLLLTAAVAAGCGEQGGSSGPYKGGLDERQKQEDLRNQYSETLGRAYATMEDPQAMPVAMAVSRANKAQLLGNAQRWDAALAVLKAATPPKDAKAAHSKLVQAMEGLSEWNRKIAAAAPSKPRVKSTARKARASADSKAYGEAQAELQQLGYLPSDDAPLDEQTPIN